MIKTTGKEKNYELIEYIMNLYDPAGSVAGIKDQDGCLWRSYRYDAFGNATFGSPQYDNEYTFHGESYNQNIHSRYLRERYPKFNKVCRL